MDVQLGAGIGCVAGHHGAVQHLLEEAPHATVFEPGVVVITARRLLQMELRLRLPHRFQGRQDFLML